MKFTYFFTYILSNILNMLWVYLCSKNDDNDSACEAAGEAEEEGESESDVVDANSIYKGWSMLKAGSKLER